MKHLLFAIGTLLSFHCIAQTPDFAWLRDLRGSGTEEIRDVAVDASGNVYVTGSFNSGVMTAGTTTLTNSGSGGTSDIFLVKYDRTGTVLWARKAGGGDQDYGVSVAADASGNVFICGWFQSSMASFG